MASDCLDMPLAIAPVARLGWVAAAAPGVATALGYDIAAAGRTRRSLTAPSWSRQHLYARGETGTLSHSGDAGAVAGVWLTSKFPYPGRNSGPGGGPACGAMLGGTQRSQRKGREA